MPVLPAGKAPRLYIDVVQPITSERVTQAKHLTVICGYLVDLDPADPHRRTRMPVLARKITLADFEIQHQTLAGAPSTDSDDREAFSQKHTEGVSGSDLDHRLPKGCGS